MKVGEQQGSFLSSLAGKIFASKKAGEDQKRNLTRLEEAALVSRELGAQRITDEEIKKITVRLVYEADRYISFARKSEGAFYEPLVLYALDTARSAINDWKKNENAAAAGKYLNVQGRAEGIVIPAASVEQMEDGGREPSTGNREIRERTLGILEESLQTFIMQNSIHSAGDLDAATSALSEINRRHG